MTFLAVAGNKKYVPPRPFILIRDGNDVTPTEQLPLGEWDSSAIGCNAWLKAPPEISIALGAPALGVENGPEQGGTKRLGALAAAALDAPALGVGGVPERGDAEGLGALAATALDAPALGA